ncbi:MAG: glycosyltransferase family 4 protein [Phycisphaerae bacterium]
MDEKPVQILFLDHTAVLSGAELSMLNLVQRLDAARFVPTVLLFADGPLVGALREAGVAVEVLPLADAVRGAGRGSLGVGSLAKLGAIFTSAAFMLRLARYIRAAKPDIVHCNSLKADVLGGLAARLAGVKVIWHIHDRIETDYLPATVVKVFRFLLRHIPHSVIANSQGTLETLKLPQGKRWAVVYPCVPAIAGKKLEVRSSKLEDNASRQVYPAGQNESAALPHSNSYLLTPNFSGTTTKDFVVVLVGRISPWKGQDVFIRAAAIVLKQFPACRFQIVGSALFGEDALLGQLQQLAVSLGVADRVEFLGFRKDIPEIIAASTLLVHASTTAEPFGQVIVQAMVESKPVVATRGGGVLEIVEDGKTGLLVPMKDVDAMAKAIGELLADPVRARKMGEAGRARFLEKFTIEQTVREVERVYGSMTNDGEFRS